MTTGSTRLLAVAPAGVRGGAQLVLRRALACAGTRGWQISCICPPGGLAADLRADGHHVLDGPDLLLPAGPRSSALARLALRELRLGVQLRRLPERPDVVVANGIMVLPSLLVARSPAPAVLLVHDVITRGDRLQLLRRCRSIVHCAIAVSEAAAVAPREAGIRTEIVANGTPWPLAAAPATPPQPPVIGCVGALTPLKGQDVLLEAVGRLGRNDVLVELIGEALPKDAAYADGLRQRSVDLGLADRVRFSGRVAEPAERVRGWTVAISASVEPEGFGLSTVEAMSVGVAVVGTDHGGTPDLIGESGLLVPPGDPEALAAALSRLLDDDDLRSRFAAAGRQRVARNFAEGERTAELVDVIAAAAR